MAKPNAVSSGFDFRDYATFFLSTGVLVALDQFSKYIITLNFPLNTGKTIISGFFNIVHVRNTGGAFSVFATSGSEWRRFVFIVLALVVVGIISYAYGRVPKSDRWNRAAYTFITGGAVGNLVDRIRMGEVIDFLDFYAGGWHWPAFNVADIGISTGAVMLLVSLLRGR